MRKFIAPVCVMLLASCLLFLNGCKTTDMSEETAVPPRHSDTDIDKWSTMSLPEKESLADSYRNDKMRFDHMTAGQVDAHGLSVMLKAAQPKGDSVWVNLVLLPGDCVTLSSVALPVKPNQVECCLEEGGLAFRHPNGARMFFLPEHPQWRSGMLFPLSKPHEMGKMFVRIQLLGVQPGFSADDPS